MAQPHKGPRRGFLLRWTDEDRLLVKTHSSAAGLTMTDYLVALVRRDEIDPQGCPVWVAGEQRVDQLPMELSA
jgi:hypothetical protein